ncbi:MAG: hypothetical protein LBT50_10810 [Prevotellaceae bacterium]|jgi:hypothetical protein|nr:hypothetical protein [Prevotellaceae bacterium]
MKKVFFRQRYRARLGGNEVDFVMPNIETPFAVEIKYDRNGVKESKYRKFAETYPDIPLSYNYLQPFAEDFFRRQIFYGLKHYVRAT